MTAWSRPAQLLVIAKEPVPGRVKTRLCPPCTPEQAAAIAAAAIEDTLRIAGAAPATGHTLVLSGRLTPPPEWSVVSQHGSGLGDRLANAFTDTTRPGLASLLIGMDTPHLSLAILSEVVGHLEYADAVIGPATDGGWWALGLRDPRHATALRAVAMSTSDTGAATIAALRRLGLRVAVAASLRDVDTAADALEVAAAYPDGAFAAAVRDHLPVVAAC